MENDLQFERAEFTAPAATACNACQQPLAGEYFSANGQVLCAGCADRLRQQLGAADGNAGHLLQAALFGLGAAVLGGAIYGAVMAYAHLEIGLISIAVGMIVGRAVRKGSGNFGGRQFQFLAAALTYASICGAYAFFSYQQLGQPTGDELSTLIFSAYRLPFAQGAENILGILIIGFGVYQAWQINRGFVIAISGPHPLAPGTPPAPPTSG